MSSHASTSNTASSAETERFQHKTLPDPRNHLRLLEITSVDETRDMPVHCKLTTWPVTKAPVYTAISYTWGDPQQPTSVLINSRVMEVRRNCEYVLKQAWRQGASSYVWIDAICINQIDNDEKNSQVAMMSGVYQRAGQVLACVGRHENDSEFLFERLRNHIRWWRKFRSMDLETPTSGVLHYVYDFFVGKSCRLLMRKLSLVRLFRAVINFLERPYFHRVWINQELFYGRDIHICCDDQTIPLSLLWGLYVVMFACPTSRWDNSLGPATSEVDFVLEAGAVGTGKLELQIALLRQVTVLQCEDRRDQLFGILSMIDWGDRKPIQPDYSKDSFDLAVETMAHMKNGRHLGWIIENALTLGRILGFWETPTTRLNVAIEERRSNSFHAVPASPTRRCEKLPITARFWGQRLCFDNTRWKFQPPQPKDAADRSGSRLWNPSVLSGDGSSPMIQQWSGVKSWDPLNTDILLPQEARPGDWLLVQEHIPIYSAGWEVPDVLLLARDNGNHQLQLAGKALIIQFNHWPTLSTWTSDWRGRSMEHFVYLDPKDAVVLALNLYPVFLKSPKSRERPDPLGPEWPKRQAQKAGGYFETKLSSEGSISYAIPSNLNTRF